MRRRQAFAAQSAAREAALSSQHLGPSEPVNILPKPEDYVGGPLTISTNPNACPKCGKIVTRGKFMHQKHCKGSAP